ncbi:MAG: hypothetical protein WKF58_17195 [Ilumatobacteraceae bacterium]
MLDLGGDHDGDPGCAGGTSRSLVASTRTATRLLDIAVGLCQPEPDVEEIGEQVDDLIAPVLAEFDMDTLFASSGD